MLLLEASSSSPPTTATPAAADDDGRSALLLAAAAAGLPVAVAVYGTDGRVRAQNALSERLLGRDHHLRTWWGNDAVPIPARFRGELHVPTHIRREPAWHWVALSPYPAGGTVACHVPLDTIDAVRALRLAKVPAAPPPSHTHSTRTSHTVTSAALLRTQTERTKQSGTATWTCTDTERERGAGFLCSVANTGWWGGGCDM
jgi:hypothetical protein